MPHVCQILCPDETGIRTCAHFMNQGEVVGLPTETVYGLAGNALNPSSVRKIFEVKGRPFIDPLIVHCRSLKQAQKHAIFSLEAERLAQRYWPGALTLVLPKRDTIPDLVTAGLPSVAIRISGHPLFRRVLEQLDFPLAAPSANPFGYVSPTLAEHVFKTLGQRIPAVLDGGSCQHGIESTIVDLRNPAQPVILRPGPISPADLGIKSNREAQSAKYGCAQTAPGMLTQHYSPSTGIRLFPSGYDPAHVDPDAAILFNKRPSPPFPHKNIFWLSEDGRLEDIAHNLFRLLQKLDCGKYSCLHVEQVRPEGIGIAINDRLDRAAAK